MKLSTHPCHCTPVNLPAHPCLTTTMTLHVHILPKYNNLPVYHSTTLKLLDHSCQSAPMNCEITTVKLPVHLLLSTTVNLPAQPLLTTPVDVCVHPHQVQP